VTDLQTILAAPLVVSFSVLGILLSKAKYHSLLSPPAIYCIIWGSALLLATTNAFGEGYFHPLPDSVFIMFSTAMVMFVLGGLCVPHNTSLYFRRQRPPDACRSCRGLWFFALCLSVIGFVGSFVFLFSVVKSFGMESYLVYGSLVREALLKGEKAIDFPGGIWNYRFAYYFLQAAVFLSAALGAMFVMISKKQKLFFYIPIASAILFDLAILGRMRIYTVTVIYAFAFLFRTKAYVTPTVKEKKKIRRHAVLFILLLCFLGVLGCLSVSVFRNIDVDTHQRLYGFPVPGALLHPLRYQIGGLYLFSVAHSAYGSWTYGYEVYYHFFGKTMNLVGLSVPHFPFILGDNHYVGEDHTMRAFHTYLFAAYRDFGLLGPFVYPFILGWLGGFLYRKAFAHSNVLWKANLVLFYALILVPSTVIWGLGEFGRASAFFLMLGSTIVIDFLKGLTRRSKMDTLELSKGNVVGRADCSRSQRIESN
jgi:oligosaccharide repeat unit polymerase